MSTVTPIFTIDLRSGTLSFTPAFFNFFNFFKIAFSNFRGDLLDKVCPASTAFLLMVCMP